MKIQALKRLTVASLLVLALTCIAARGQSPSVTSSKTTYLPGEAITINFSGGPGNPKDWIGIYPEGVIPDGDPASTVWNYVDGTQAGDLGVASGSITFPDGLPAGSWVAHLLENDGYTSLAQASFQVATDETPSGPAILLVQHGMYVTETPITIVFTNGPANPKDWIAVYPEGIVPEAGTTPTLRTYADGTPTGNEGRGSGFVNFQSGISTAGRYTAFLLENDGYTILASNAFQVVTADAPILRLNKRIYLRGESITVAFTNAPGNPTDWIGVYPAGVVPDGDPTSTIWFYVNNTQTATEPVLEGEVTFAEGLNQTGTWVAYLLENDGYTVLAEETFIVFALPSPTTNIVLPQPIYFEDFESTAEGELPTGWTAETYTEIFDDALDLQNLNSRSYANWLVVNASRFTNSFLSYSAQTPTDAYQRVLSFNPDNIVNGQVVSNLASGNFLFSNSGYRDGRSQVMYLFTRDFDLTGRTNVHLSFHSIYEQNQDSIGAVEYSIDGGTNWLPIVYMIDEDDIITNEAGIDVVTTLTTEYSDVAYYDDPLTGETRGGTYGAFIGAPISEALAPYISGRVDDDAVASKRVEVFRLPEADNQARVRFRFAYAGTDSWYFGIDNFGIYSFSDQPVERPKLSISRVDNSVTISWTGGDGPFRLEKSTSLESPNWQPVTVPAGSSSVTENVSGNSAFYRLVDL